MEKQSGMRVAGLVLAAGISKRMGQPKQLLDRDGVTLLDHILGEVMRSELDLVVLVLGHRAQEIRAGLTHDLNDPALRVIENRNYRDGISSSIIAGLSEAEEGYDY
ncbi:MAG: NTP transferase domain-containing protein, partial [Deltaproteobacteria bacterium]|nr:NTP transferase domain-containing protein [Deltaproteobacteria bacterium]